MEEKTLIEQCIKNNRTAQHEMFKKIGGRFFAVLIRYVGNKDEAEDLLQEGFFKLFNSLGNYKFEGSFEEWIRKIMVNTAIDYLKRKKDFVFSFSDLSEEEELVLKNSSEELTDLEQKYIRDIPPKKLFEIIEKLSPGYRVVFNLRAIEGYTHKEIAEKLNITEGTSKSNYSKARIRLKKYLNEYFSKRI